MIALIIVGALFLWYFILIFLLSFHPKTRALADKYFHFRDRTELEELKLEIENIKSKLGSIETTLKTLGSKEDKE